MTIYLVGLENDKTLLRFASYARERRDDVELVNLHAVVKEPWRFTLPPAAGTSLVYGTKSPLKLDPHAGYYVRSVDLSTALEAQQAKGWRHMLLALTSFLETVTGPVVNRPGAHSHNGAKPFHEWWLAQQGFSVPPAITSSNPDALVAFTRLHGSAVLKALSGTRGSAQLITERDLDSFVPARGPIHLQRPIRGYDVRAHVVGEEIYSERIECESIDYRDSGADARHSLTQLPRWLMSKLITASRAMGLAFTGWDFKVDANGTYWCLEANPMPGYDVYDRRAGGAISGAILRFLCHGPTY